MTPNQTIEIFFSYAKEDVKLRNELAKHLGSLEHKRTITAWHESEISAGKERVEEIKKHLNSASIILLLISSDFINSEELWQIEVTRAMEKHEKQEARVIPVLLRSCVWDSTPFGKLEPLPKNKIAITSWINKDEAFTDVVQGIQQAVKEISGLKEAEETKSVPLIKKWLLNIPWRSVRNVSISSISVTFLIIFARFVGFFEGPELWLFDNMMRLQPTGKPDDRLLVIEVTPKDIEAQGNEPRQDSSLTEGNVLKILEKLLENPENKPKAIGLDILRDFEAKDNKLQQILKNEENSIFAICNIGDKSQGNKGVKPPPELSQKRLGFSDLFLDRDHVLRRVVLKMNNPNDSPCKTKTDNQPVEHSLSLQLVRHYFKDKTYQDPLDGTNSSLKIGNTEIESLFSDYRSGYSMWTNLKGYQILVKYLKACKDGDCSLENIAPKVTVTQVLEEDVLQKYDDLKKRIVLIGVTDNSRETPWPTPFSSGGHKDISGVFIHAQVVSQLLRAVDDKDDDNKPLLEVLFIGHEMLWIFAWSLAGGILAQKCRTIKGLTWFGGIAFFSLYVTCLIVFIFPSVWIPFYPSALSFLGTGGVVLFIRLKPQKSA